jgi:predicted peptidase
MMLVPRVTISILLAVLLFSCQKQLSGDAGVHEVIETEPPILKANVDSITNAIGGYYSAIPVHYTENTKKYPLLLFIHGGGEAGNGNTDLPLILNEGIPRLLKEQTFPPNFKVQDKNFSFIILAPQLKYYPDNSEIFSFLSFARKKYRIDSSRIYLAGLSSGGRIVCDVSAESPSSFAAIVAMSGVSVWGDVNDKCKRMAEGKLPIWVFHNDKDRILDVEAVTYFISLINSFKPAIPPKYTQFPPAGINNHDSWNRASNPSYKENGLNIYEWMLQYSR